MKYLVIGLGNTGMSIISMFKYAGLNIEGFNRPGSSLESLKSLNEIKVDGLINYSYKADFIVEDLESALIRADLVFVCVPAYEHKSLANLISKIDLKDSLPSIILVPGRVFGALNFAKYLGSDVAESQTVPYASRHNQKGLISIFAKKTKVIYSSQNSVVLEKVINKMPTFLNDIFVVEDDYKIVTLSNVGLVLHCAPLIFNSGLINSDYDFLFYKDLVSEEIAFYMEQIDGERLQICNKLSIFSNSVSSWLAEQYDAQDSSNIFNALHSTNAYLKISSPKTLNHRYLNEDLVFGLVPLEILAINLDLKVPFISNLINTACMLLDCDFRKKYTGIIPDWRLLK